MNLQQQAWQEQQAVQIFQNTEFGAIKVLLKDGEPIFLANPLAEILGYSKTNGMLRRLDLDEKVEFSSKEVGDNLGCTLSELEVSKFSPKVAFVTESGLFNAILGSEKEEAKKFRKWVTSEVLPSIRKHGMYASDELLDNPDLLIQVATQLKVEREEKKRLQLLNTQQKQIIGELKPKADYTDKILRSKGLVNISQIAKDYGMSAQKLNELLHNLGVQYKQSQQWLLYSKYHDKGYTHSETVDIVRSNGMADVRMTTKWTQKGRLFIYELLKQNDILPVIER